MSVIKWTLFHKAENNEQFESRPNINELIIFDNFCVCVNMCTYVHVFLIILMLANMFVFDLIMFVNSCNVL